LGDDRAIAPLIGALGDEEEGVRGAAVGALRAIGDVRAVDPEFAALRDEIEPLVADLGSEDRSRDAMEALVPALERSLRSIDADLLRRVNMLSDHVSFWPSSWKGARTRPTRSTSAGTTATAPTREAGAGRWASYRAETRTGTTR
jgi:uncharacterized small protein (DUF1192 family)